MAHLRARLNSQACVVFVFVLLLTGTFFAPTADWVQFKHDAARSGDAAQVKLNFPMKRTIAVSFPAPIYASPAVAAGRVYIQDARGNIACVKASTGAVLWTTSVPGINNCSTPAVAGGKVFIGSTSGLLLVLDAASGSVLKKVPAPGGIHAAPALTTNAVYVPTFDGYLLKTDLDGNLVWSYRKADTKRPLSIGLTDIAVRGNEIYFPVNRSLMVIADDGATSRVVKELNFGFASGFHHIPIAGPVCVGSDMIAYQTFDHEWGRLFLTRLSGGEASFEDNTDGRTTVAVRGNRLFRGDFCFKAEIGTASEPKIPALWKADANDIPSGGFQSSAALSANAVVIGTDEGKVQFLPIDLVDGAGTVTESTAPNKTRMAKSTFAVQKLIWSFQTPLSKGRRWPVSSSPAISDGSVYFGCEDGVLYGLGTGTEMPTTAVAAPAGMPPGRSKLSGTEWTTPGGDMGYSMVSAATKVKPPFRVKWRQRLWGGFKGGVVAADGKLFASGEHSQVIAIDAANGEVIWRAFIPYVDTYQPPTYADGKLLLMKNPIAGFKRQDGKGLWCLDAQTGAVLWQHPFDFNCISKVIGPVVLNGTAILGHLDENNKPVVRAYDLGNGSVVWSMPIANMPAVVNPGKVLGLFSWNVPHFCGIMADSLFVISVSYPGGASTTTSEPTVLATTIAVNPLTGREVWRNSNFVGSTIRSRKGIVVVFNGNGNHGLKASNGSHLWSSVTKAHNHPKPLADEFLAAKGARYFTTSVRMGCWVSTYANGYWLNSEMTVFDSSRTGMVLPDADQKPNWKYAGFFSQTCPTSIPAYNLVYHLTNGEGVLYAFESTAAVSITEKAGVPKPTGRVAPRRNLSIGAAAPLEASAYDLQGRALRSPSAQPQAPHLTIDR